MARARRSSSAPSMVRASLWIERGGVAALTEAGADLLEQIQAKGSLSEAARSLRFSYRRAWMLLDAMNKRWDAPLVLTAVGGKKGGGAKLTELGSRVLRSFRDLQIHIEAAIDHEIDGFRRATR
ncbi:MAG: putative transcriptional regulator, ModE family [Phycisphaerales bacterium]|nr:putative transcriptional regulator, ModE family [Phycisphaerales bacterium]